MNKEVDKVIRAVGRSGLGALLVVSLNGCGLLPEHSSVARQCYTWTGLYKLPSSGNYYSDREFYSSTRDCLDKNENPDEYTCPTYASTIVGYIKFPLAIYRYGDLIENSCIRQDDNS